jgi:hypothetical protein
LCFRYTLLTVQLKETTIKWALGKGEAGTMPMKYVCACPVSVKAVWQVSQASGTDILKGSAIAEGIVRTRVWEYSVVS